MTDLRKMLVQRTREHVVAGVVSGFYGSEATIWPDKNASWISARIVDSWFAMAKWTAQNGQPQVDDIIGNGPLNLEPRQVSTVHTLS